MNMDHGSCAVCGGSRQVIAGRDTKGAPIFKQCPFCKIVRNRLLLLALWGMLIALGVATTYLWIS